jgi:hypothetical protein
MKIFKGLAVVVALTFVLGISASAQTQCAPGDVPTPPCAVAQIASDDAVGTDQTSAAPATSTQDVFTFSEATIDVLLSALSVF